MAVETELKLRIAPEDMERLRHHALLKRLSPGHAATRTLRNIYFDTPDLRLHRQEMALRLRQAGGQWLQTLKGGGGVEAGLHSRNEWETEVAGQALDLPALRATGAKLPPGIAKSLQPVFSTDFTRSVLELRYDGAAIELCMDSGEIRAGTRTRPISELELELKEGEPQALFHLALELLEIVPLEVEPSSKAEYGYGLFGGGEPAVVKARFPRLQEDERTASALRNMIASCLLHVQGNVPGAIANLDEEYLHQVRVGLRRLRVVLAMARAWRSDAVLDALRAETGELSERLGVVRDWDVFVAQILRPVSEAFPQHAGLAAVLGTSEQKRQECHVKMRATLESRDLQRLVLRLGGWMQGGYWQARGGRKAALADFAARILRKRAKRVARHGKHIAGGAPQELHALRIACKKLRYSGDMLGSLFKAAATRRYLSALSSLQDALGALNDLATARRLLADKSLAADAETRALLRDWIDLRHKKKLRELNRSWKRFASLESFWEA